MTEIRLSPVADFDALGSRWRDLESRARGSFFQSWTWTGTLAGERFPDPVLVEATERGQTVALGLFNRVRRRFGPATLYLGESGDPERDSPWIEHNGILCLAGREAELTEACLRAATRYHDVVISGAAGGTIAAFRRAAGPVFVKREQDSPYVDLAALRASGCGYLAGRSANTRQQIRRSDRFYRQFGELCLDRASGLDASLAMLEEMASLHQASWIARNQPGAFARPFFGRFHRALLARAVPHDEAILIKISCKDTVVGILYNFLYGRRMLAYQSGFDYRQQAAKAKPGLTSHAAAIAWAVGQQVDVYDFLAGGGRYKHSLATASDSQFWAEAGPLWSPRLLPRRLLGGVG